MLVRHCSPTLAGMKTGSMVACNYAAKEEMRDAVRRYNKRLATKGLRVLPLCYKGHRALIYIYRPSRLKKDLSAAGAACILSSLGYPENDPERCIVRLVRRMNNSDEFPHEIGLFLGYPPEDVSGFIENRAEGFKCVGSWKVYGDEVLARKTFARYKKCTDAYCAQYAKGKSIERLTVAG